MITADGRELALFHENHQFLPLGMLSYLELRFGGAAVGRDGFASSRELQTAMEQVLTDYRSGIVTDDMLTAAIRIMYIRKQLYDDYQNAMTCRVSLCRVIDDARDFIDWSDLYEDFEAYQMREDMHEKEVCHDTAVRG